MLVLSRRVGEKIIIKVGDEVITITATAIRPKTVRLGFEANEQVRIDREEVCNRRESK